MSGVPVPNNSKLTLFQKMLQASKEPGMHTFFHVPLQQLVHKLNGTDWELTLTEKQMRYSSVLFEYLHRRFGRDGNTKNNTVLLSPDLIKWLNEPAKGDYPMLITNFMWLTLNYVKPFDRLYDIKTKKGIQDYYLDMAGKYYIGMALPSCLMPAAVFDYLSENYPCANAPSAPVLPLSRGLAHLWREYIPEVPFAPDNAMSRAHFFMRYLVFAQVTEADLRMFSKELIAYLNAPLFASDRSGAAATGLIYEVFRLAGMGDDPKWNTPSFVSDKIQQFYAGALNSLVLPPEVASHHQALARTFGGVSDAVKVLPQDIKANKKYILQDEAALPIDTQKALVNLIEAGEAHAPFNAITSCIAKALDAVKVARTYILPEYDNYPQLIKSNNLENKPWAKLNLFALDLDKAADMMLSQGLKYFNGRINIGYCTWETSQLAKANKVGLPLLDEVWVPTEYVKQVFTAQTQSPVHVMPYPIALAKPSAYLNRASFGLADNTFMFLNTLDCVDWMSRKNPLAIARAFQKAFPNQPDVRLVIKTRNMDKPKVAAEYLHLRHIQEMTHGDPRIILIHKDLSDSDMSALMHMADAYVSLHRHSAYGRAIMEAMSIGKPAVVTKGSGPADYATEQTAALVNAIECSTIYDAYYHLENERGHRWLDPDVVHAATQMRRIVDDKAYAQSIAKAGQAYINTHYSAQSTGTKMLARLNNLMASHHGNGA